MGRAKRAYLAKATWYLFLARCRLLVTPIGRVVDGLVKPHAASAESATPNATIDLRLVAWALARLQDHLPWRADCLVQAMAASRWLTRHGYSPRVSIGVTRNDRNELLAHAWTYVGEFAVTGGAQNDTFRLLAEPGTLTTAPADSGAPPPDERARGGNG